VIATHVYTLQVWRPVRGRHDVTHRHQLRHRGGDVITLDVAGGGDYTLIGQTYFQPRELRFHELFLDDAERIKFRRGDVLGVHLAHYSPLAWSVVPCAQPTQRYLVARRATTTTDPPTSGLTLRFDVETAPDDRDCRQYSFNAVLGLR